MENIPTLQWKTNIQHILIQMHGTVVLKDKYDENRSSKKMKIDQSNCLNSTSSNTIEITMC